MVYQPREDSFLLQKIVKKKVKSKDLVLDLGTGSGIQALTAAQKAKQVIAVDIDQKAISQLRKRISQEKIKNLIVLKSYLFSNKKLKNKKFDLIIFNPPYLPKEKKEKLDKDIHGGKKGHELIEKFLEQASAYLKPNGKILLLFSSLTKPTKVAELIQKFLFEKKKLSQQRIFFEDLFVYEIKKSTVLKKLEKKGLTELRFIAKGWRGIVYQAKWEGKKVAVKTQRKETKAKNVVEKETKMLKLVNKKNIGPKLIFANKEFLITEWIDGLFILDFIRKSNKKQINSVLKKTFHQMFILDQLKINKEEMHRPLKHIIVTRKNKQDTPVLIDFERAKKIKPDQKPHNVTQFGDFILRIRRELRIKGITINKTKLITLLKDYKHHSPTTNYGASPFIKQIENLLNK